jgi:membrane protein
LQFSAIYYFAPDLKAKRWHWMTPGAAIGIFGWLVSSLGFRVYLYYFHSFTITYGSLGAVIILLTWFYMTGLMLLLGAEINSEIQAAVTEKKMKEAGEIPAHVSAEPEPAAQTGHAAAGQATL